MIAFAYDIPIFVADQHISGGPGWMAIDRFSLEAKAGNASATAAELRSMLQSLLADRFKLQFHRETKEVGGYALVVGKSGFKDKSFFTDRTSLACGSPTTMALAECLSSRLGKPVLDETGITGSHNFSLTMESLAEDQPFPPSLFTVLEEQLGLKLESRRLPSVVLTIDHAEKPSEN